MVTGLRDKLDDGKGAAPPNEVEFVECSARSRTSATTSTRRLSGPCSATAVSRKRLTANAATLPIADRVLPETDARAMRNR